MLLFTFMQLVISKHLCVLILINRSAVGPITLALQWENIAISSRTIIFLWWGPPSIDFLNHSHLNLSVCLIGTLARLNASRGKWDYCVSAWGLNALEINGGCISNPPALHCTILSVSFCSLPAFQPQIFYYFFIFSHLFSLCSHSLTFLSPLLHHLAQARWTAIISLSSYSVSMSRTMYKVSHSQSSFPAYAAR